jgi:hypothetical protein
MVIDGGYGDNMGSIDLSGDEPIVVREGKGSLDILKFKYLAKYFVFYKFYIYLKFTLH